MLRTYITPNNTNVNIIIPPNYVGKKIEILMYAVDELNENKNIQETIKRKPSEYVGAISKETAIELLNYIEQSRNEWEQDI